MKMSKGKPPKNFHTPSNNKSPGGTDMGEGVKNPMAKTVSSYLSPKSSSRKMGKAPRSLA